MQPGVQSQVAQYKIWTRVPIEIARDDAIPPSRGVLESANGHAFELRTRVPEDGDRHPLAHDDEIEPAVLIDVCPERVGDHTHARELRCDLRGHIGKVSAPAALEQRARRRDAVTARRHAGADEHVVVRDREARSAGKQWWQLARRLFEGAVAVAQVEPVLERGREIGELAAAGYDIEIEIAVAVRIEEGRAEIFGDAVGVEERGAR